MNEYLELIYRLDYLIRYSNVPRIHDESVAAHSFCVAAILFKLYEEYDFDLGIALQIAICHDIPELKTNDLSHETKKLFPEIKEILKKAERIVLEELPKEISKGWELYQDESSTEALVVHLADAMQCRQYSITEVNMGNRGYMLEVRTNSNKRVEILKEKLIGVSRGK